MATRAIPVIVVSAQNIEDMPEPERALIAAFVMKPIDPPGFVRLVDRFLAGSSEPVASSRRSWRCTACFSEWLRPRDEPPGQDARCIRCDGPLVLIEAARSPKSLCGSPKRKRSLKRAIAKPGAKRLG